MPLSPTPSWAFLLSPALKAMCSSDPLYSKHRANSDILLALSFSPWNQGGPFLPRLDRFVSIGDFSPRSNAPKVGKWHLC